MNVFQRPAWSGEPKQLADVFTARKGNMLTICQLWSNQFGFELRLMVGAGATTRS